MSQEIVIQPQPRLWLEGSILQPYTYRATAHSCVAGDMHRVRSGLTYAALRILLTG